MAVETLLLEMRERLQSSDYWIERRARSTCITCASIFFKEVAEYAWLIYGVVLYFSDESEGCSDEAGGFMLIMLLFLILCALRLLLVLLIIAVFGYEHLSQRL